MSFFKVINVIVFMWIISSYIIYPYMWTHRHWTSVTRILDNLPAKAMLLGTSRICSKSHAVKLVGKVHDVYPLSSLLKHHFYVQTTIQQLLFGIQSNPISISSFILTLSFNPVQNGPFWGCWRMGVDGA